MKAEIITIGDEILLGQIIDSNAQFMSEKLASVGVDIIRITTIGDGDLQIVDAIHEAMNRADLVLTTGGLGPTDDDLTKHAICRAFDRKLVFHQDLYDLIVRRYERRGMTMPELVRSQAEQPENATLFDNPIGSAVGILIEEGEKRVISMPGVPLEMKAIMEGSVIPYLKNLQSDFYIVYKNILTFGTFESYLAKMIEEHQLCHDDCELAFLPSVRGVILRLTYKGKDRELGDRLVADYGEKLKEMLGELYVSDDGRDMVQTTTDLLLAKKKTVAVAESCTGGMITAKLTDISGSSAYFQQGVVTYSNKSKTDLVGVPQEVILEKGAVSKEVVRYMVENIRKTAGADYALAVSGIAGPTGDTPDKPLGLIFIGISSDDGVEVHRHVFGKFRDINRERTTYHALNYLRLKLLKS